ncbi:MAG: hypothetical protein IPH78_07385 [Bacteroidetes bacterium]|nr:hypothetical protein [Bacteroidota bacterium]
MSEQDKIQQLLQQATQVNQKLRKNSLPMLEEALHLAKAAKDAYLTALVNTRIAFYRASFTNEYAIALSMARAAYNSLRPADRVKAKAPVPIRVWLLLPPNQRHGTGQRPLHIGTQTPERGT